VKEPKLTKEELAVDENGDPLPEEEVGSGE